MLNAAPPRSLVALLTLILLLTGCTKSQPMETSISLRNEPDYTRQLPSGQSALRRIPDPADWPDIESAYRAKDALLVSACDESARWFEAPSSRRSFPLDEITHERAQASVLAMRALLAESSSSTSFRRDLEHMFDVYESVGWNGDGDVLFTGYFAPIFPASRTPSERFGYPLYTRPADLVTDELTGQPYGRQLPDGTVTNYFTRKEIEETNLLEGQELVWLEDALSAYLIHVNGSAKLRMQDGSIMYIGYAGKTDRPYASLGKAMIRARLVNESGMNLAAIRRIYRKNPEAVEQLMYENENFVFFREYDGGVRPAGSLGVRVTSEASLATDKKIYPRGGIVMVDTRAITFASGQRRFQRFMLDQDTGGAIQAPGRADIFMGIGPSAEILAGGQHAEGKLYYFFLKPEFVDQTLAYHRRVAEARTASVRGVQGAP